MANGFKTARTQLFYQVFFALLIVPFFFVVFVSGWWILATPFYILIAMVLASGISEIALKPHATARGFEAVTCILTAGEEKKPCTLIICPNYLGVDMGDGRLSPTVHLDAITGLLFQQMTILTGFGIDYTDGDGQARLMFVNDGEGQGNRTRKILKAIQDAMMAIPMDAPEVTDISKAIKTAKNSVVHRV
jgi:hypothetical protein